MKWVWLGLSILFTSFVFGMSGTSGETSGSLSLSLTTWAAQVLEVFTPWFTEHLDTFHSIVRKSAHVAEYFLLGIAWTKTAILFHWRLWPMILLGLTIALFDEGVQLIAIDRGPSLLDALFFDVPGFLLGWGLLFGIKNSRMNTNAS
jgi:VanZ family protein